MYIPREERDQGFIDAVAEWIEDIFLRHPRREEISDDAIDYALEKVKLSGGLKGRVLRKALDWLLPERFGRFLAELVRRTGARLFDQQPDPAE